MNSCLGAKHKYMEADVHPGKDKLLQLTQGSATFINQRAILALKRTKTVQEPHNIFEAYNEGNTAYLLSLN